MKEGEFTSGPKKMPRGALNKGWENKQRTLGDRGGRRQKGYTEGGTGGPEKKGGTNARKRKKNAVNKEGCKNRENATTKGEEGKRGCSREGKKTGQ